MVRPSFGDTSSESSPSIRGNNTSSRLIWGLILRHEFTASVTSASEMTLSPTIAAVDGLCAQPARAATATSGTAMRTAGFMDEPPGDGFATKHTHDRRAGPGALPGRSGPQPITLSSSDIAQATASPSGLGTSS